MCADQHVFGRCHIKSSIYCTSIFNLVVLLSLLLISHSIVYKAYFQFRAIIEYSEYVMFEMIFRADGSTAGKLLLSSNFGCQES